MAGKIAALFSGLRANRGPEKTALSFLGIGKKTAISRLGQRVVGAAGFIGAGYVGGALLEHEADVERTRRGTSEYEAVYGTSLETAATTSRVAGYVLGARHLLRGRRSEQIGRAYTKRARMVPKRMETRVGHTDVLEFTGKMEPNYTQLNRLTARYRKIGLKKGYAKRFTESPPRVLRSRTAKPKSLARGLLTLGYTLPIVGEAVGAVSSLVKRDYVSSAGWASVGAATVAGAYIGTNTARYPAAEGNITEIQDQSSVVRKLNYSTAGLTQALHYNRKVY